MVGTGNLKWSPLMLTDYIKRRRAHGDQWRTIADDFGVSVQSADGWLNGTINPSKTVLILAELLSRQSAGEWPLR
jgi:hypothetical protein